MAVVALFAPIALCARAVAVRATHATNTAES
jgi:hypothetical protein